MGARGRALPRSRPADGRPRRCPRSERAEPPAGPAPAGPTSGQRRLRALERSRHALAAENTEALRSDRTRSARRDAGRAGRHRHDPLAGRRRARRAPGSRAGPAAVFSPARGPRPTTPSRGCGGSPGASIRSHWTPGSAPPCPPSPAAVRSRSTCALTCENARIRRSSAWCTSVWPNCRPTSPSTAARTPPLWRSSAARERVRLVVTDDGQGGEFPAAGSRLTGLDRGWRPWAGPSGSPPRRRSHDRRRRPADQGLIRAPSGRRTRSALTLSDRVRSRMRSAPALSGRVRSRTRSALALRFGRSRLRQVGEHRLDPAVVGLGGGRSNFRKMAAACFSTARSVTTRRWAIDRLECPCAMRPSTSRSRRVSARCGSAGRRLPTAR